VSHGSDSLHLSDVLVFLAAVAIVVPLLRRLKTNPVIGYLAVGAALGPFALKVLPDIGTVHTLAEFGVVFLLFTIGLELSAARLLAMRRLVFGLGAAQVLVTAAAIGGIAWAWGNSAEASLILGACLALSSTAVVVELLLARGEFASRAGRATFAVLLFQDLAVIPILFLVTVFAQADGGAVMTGLGLALAKAALAVAAIVVAGRLIVRPLFRFVGTAHSAEFFVATALLVVLGTGWIASLFGLSMALGAFLAGLLLAETEFRHQVDTDIQPFKGLLLGLFFISVGMAIDFAEIAANPFWIAAAVIGLIALKAAIAVALGLLFGLPREVAVQTGLLLGEGGEFAFVAIQAAMLQGVIEGPVSQFMLIVTTFSLVLTPGLAALAARLAAWLARRAGEGAHGVSQADAAELADHVVIAGFGRVGRTVARLLDLQQVAYVAVDLDSARVASGRADGRPVFFGDASRPEVLRRLGAERASAVVVTLNAPSAVARTVTQIRVAWPHLRLFARAHDTAAAAALTALGANLVVPETVESSLQLGRSVLIDLGTPSSAVEELVARFREVEFADYRAGPPRAAKPESES